jgi:hypothetical protein
MMGLRVRLARWLRNQVRTIPEDMAVCEFECSKTTCTWGDWKECQRRRMTVSGKIFGADQATPKVQDP